jgi:hypothetical protein
MFTYAIVQPSRDYEALGRLALEIAAIEAVLGSTPALFFVTEDATGALTAPVRFSGFHDGESIYINVNLEPGELVRTVYHEVAHAKQFEQGGPTLAKDVAEGWAHSWARSHAPGGRGYDEVMTNVLRHGVDLCFDFDLPLCAEELQNRLAKHDALGARLTAGRVAAFVGASRELEAINDGWISKAERLRRSRQAAAHDRKLEAERAAKERRKAEFETKLCHLGWYADELRRHRRGVCYCDFYERWYGEVP